ncbi:RNA polymerase sigma factor [uncultured Friedmanniella sp.]|uniref:RNA polymerase sigma factor n=1 Tax=uncultured Friedmanniella sp. TaxID=335381 RepID=UPI0035CC2B78
MTDAASRIEQLTASVGPDVLAYLARRVSPIDDAADLYVDVLMITWRKYRSVPSDERAARAWMLGVARRCLANHRRSATRRHVLADRLRAELPRMVDTPDPDLTDRAEQLLDRLSTADRELVTLIYWEQLTSAEAAQVLRISPGAARKRLERVRATLRAELAQVLD